MLAIVISKRKLMPGGMTIKAAQYLILLLGACILYLLLNDNDLVCYENGWKPCDPSNPQVILYSVVGTDQLFL